MQQEALLSTPKSLRLTVVVFGRRNAGKSSLVNALCEQQVSIVSAIPGTTTDPVEKAVEIHGLGPVLVVDTAGFDDEGPVGNLRNERTMKELERCDIALVVRDQPLHGKHERALIAELNRRAIPFIEIVNKSDLLDIKEECEGAIFTSTLSQEGVEALREKLGEFATLAQIEEPRIVGDLLSPSDAVVLVMPIDDEAPKGRIILPQVQVLRDILDSKAKALCTQVDELAGLLEELKHPPSLVVTDSQVFESVSQLVPDDVALTSFSVLFSRFKGDIAVQFEGAMMLDRLNAESSRVLIAEACSHHAIADDIGRVKIPCLLRARVGEGLAIDHVQGSDFPNDLAKYDLVVHCGGCTLNRQMMRTRIGACMQANVPVTNYGMLLAHLNGLLLRSVSPFPDIREIAYSHGEELDR